MLLVQDFLHGQQFDDSTRSLVEGCAFLLGIVGVAEGDDEPAMAIFTFHGVTELVDIGAADLVNLLDLNGEPVFGEHVIGRALLALGGGFGGLGADGVNPSVNTHVANLHLVGDSAQCDDRPVFEIT